jgi:hypothetical protein
MLQQEAASHSLVKVETPNGAMDTSTPISQKFVAMTTPTTNMTVPEPMDQDVPVTISALQACQVQGVQQPVVPQTVTSQMFAGRAVSIAPLQTPGNPKKLYLDILLLYEGTYIIEFM